MTDYQPLIYAAQTLEMVAKRRQYGNATDAELEAAWGRLLELRWRPAIEAEIQGYEQNPPMLVYQYGQAFPIIAEYTLGSDGEYDWFRGASSIAPSHAMPLPPAPVAGKGGV